MDPALLIGPIASVVGAGGLLGIIQLWAARNKDRLTDNATIRSQLLERITKLESDSAARELALETKLDKQSTEHKLELLSLNNLLNEYIAKNIRISVEHEVLKSQHTELKLAFDKVNIKLAGITGRLTANEETTIEHRRETAENNRILTQAAVTPVVVQTDPTNPTNPTNTPTPADDPNSL